MSIIVKLIIKDDDDPNKKKFECNVCGKMISSYGNLMIHKK